MKENDALLKFYYGEMIDITYLPKYYSLNKHKCRYCNLVVIQADACIYSAYWTPHTKYIVHKNCINELTKIEAYECQKIDRDCNDCFYFDRKIDTHSIETSIEIQFTLLFPKINSTKGVCNKYKSLTFAYPNTCTLMPCFIHRKDYND